MKHVQYYKERYLHLYLAWSYIVMMRSMHTKLKLINITAHCVKDLIIVLIISMLFLNLMEVAKNKCKS